MMISLRSLAIAAVLAITPVSASAAMIEQPAYDAAHEIEFFSPIGQSFTAIGDKLTAFAFMFQERDPDLTNEALTVSIFAGTDFGGTALRSTSRLLPAGTYDTFVDFTFDLDLVVGDVYTAIVRAPNARWFLRSSVEDVYDGGALLRLGEWANGDAAFRATFADAVIPVPAALPLLVSGFGLMAAVTVRRRRA